jgi:hypothetical protein
MGYSGFYPNDIALLDRLVELYDHLLYISVA